VVLGSSGRKEYPLERGASGGRIGAGDRRRYLRKSLSVRETLGKEANEGAAAMGDEIFTKL